MAPEVALRRKYNESVDVYSYGIILWQMATDKVPFKGLNKEEFMIYVVHEGNRPKLDHSWPTGFCELLTNCWSKEPSKRPTFASIMVHIDRLLESIAPNRPWLNKRGKSLSAASASHSSWF